jgi:hypothetical protein
LAAGPSTDFRWHKKTFDLDSAGTIICSKNCVRH